MVAEPENASDQVRFAPRERQRHWRMSDEILGYSSFCLFGFWLLLLLFSYHKIVSQHRPDN